MPEAVYDTEYFWNTENISSRHCKYILEMTAEVGAPVASSSVC